MWPQRAWTTFKYLSEEVLAAVAAEEAMEATVAAAVVVVVEEEEVARHLFTGSVAAMVSPGVKHVRQAHRASSAMVSTCS
jgi:hypothetical protein